MDLLYQRYASPFLLLDQMMDCGALCEFITVLNAQADEEKTWEYYLAKGRSDISFEEFREMTITSAVQSVEREQTVKTAFIDSKELLAGFIPEEVKDEFI